MNYQAITAEIKRQAKAEGSIEVFGGVWVDTKENLITEQATWSEHDALRWFDFYAADFWITVDSGSDPVEFNEDFIREFGEDYQEELEVFA